LKLARETIRVLGAIDLDQIIGGVGGTVGAVLTRPLRMYSCNCPD
jgi:hypothetical protein